MTLVHPVHPEAADRAVAASLDLVRPSLLPPATSTSIWSTASVAVAIRVGDEPGCV